MIINCDIHSLFIDDISYDISSLFSDGNTLFHHSVLISTNLKYHFLPSPVFGSELPEADLIYLPGGFPDLFARQLHRRKQLLEQLKDYAERGGKILAEGGGMALLSQSLSNKPGGTPYEVGHLSYRTTVFYG